MILVFKRSLSVVPVQEDQREQSSSDNCMEFIEKFDGVMLMLEPVDHQEGIPKIDL